MVRACSAAACSSLLIFSESADVEIRHDLPRVFTGNGAAHRQNFQGEHPPSQTHRLDVISRVQRRVRVTQTDGKKFTYMPLGEAGGQPWSRNHEESWLLEAAWVWLVEAPGAKYPTREVVAANCSSARWQRFLEDAAVTAAGFSVATMA